MPAYQYNATQPNFKGHVDNSVDHKVELNKSIEIKSALENCPDEDKEDITQNISNLYDEGLNLLKQKAGEMRDDLVIYYNQHPACMDMLWVCSENGFNKRLQYVHNGLDMRNVNAEMFKKYVEQIDPEETNRSFEYWDRYFLKYGKD